MSVSRETVAGKRVIVVDDLMRHGSSLKEANRVLSAAGASGVVSIALVKNYKGTNGYEFDGR